MAPACSRSMRPPVARPRLAPPEERPPRLTLRAAETYRENTSRNSLAFFSARSISYEVPSSEKLTVSSAGRFSSRSSLRMTWTLRAIRFLTSGDNSGRRSGGMHIPPHRPAILPISRRHFGMRNARSREPLRSGERADQREQDRLPNTQTGERHHQPVDPHSHTARGWHPVFEGLQEVLVECHRL